MRASAATMMRIARASIPADRRAVFAMTTAGGRVYNLARAVDVVSIVAAIGCGGLDEPREQKADHGKNAEIFHGIALGCPCAKSIIEITSHSRGYPVN